MDTAVIDDLKQFILATVSQAVAELPTRHEVNKRFEQVDTRFDSLQTEMNRRFSQVDKRFDDLELKVDTIADAHAVILEEHDKAIKQLQSRLMPS